MKGTITIEGKTYDTFPNLVQHDYGFVIQFNLLLNDEKTPYDLTGATSIKFKAKLLDTSTNKISGTCTATSPATNGICTYTVALANLDTAGVLECEVEVTKATAIETVKLGRLSILEDLPT